MVVNETRLVPLFALCFGIFGESLNLQFHTNFKCRGSHSELLLRWLVVRIHTHDCMLYDCYDYATLQTRDQNIYIQLRMLTRAIE